MSQWEPMVKRQEGKGSMNQTGTVTELQNKRHENKNRKKQTLHLYNHFGDLLTFHAIMLTFHAIIMI